MMEFPKGFPRMGLRVNPSLPLTSVSLSGHPALTPSCELLAASPTLYLSLPCQR